MPKTPRSVSRVLATPLIVAVVLVVCVVGFVRDGLGDLWREAWNG